jgi:hypothetical protein
MFQELLRLEKARAELASREADLPNLVRFLAVGPHLLHFRCPLSEIQYPFVFFWYPFVRSRSLLFASVSPFVRSRTLMFAPLPS